MSNKTNKFKTIFALILSVGIFVPIWGTFHSFVGIQNAWAAFASAALFFATGHKIKESIKITVSHAIGLVWGLLLFILMGHPVFQSLNPLLTSVLVLGGLGILAVIITNLGENIFSHLPSLFCGWAVTVGSLGGVPVSGWGHQPVDILLSLIAGVIFLGIGISQFQALLCKIFNVQAVENPAVAQPASEAKVNKAAKEKVKKEEKSRQANSKYLSYVNLYHSENSGKESEQTKSVGDLSDIKSEISDIKNYLTKMPTGAPTGGFENTSVKIVGICGSPHKNGSTIVYIKKALEMAKSIGNVTTELIELAGKDIKPCMGCKSDKCLDKCKLNDAMQEIYPVLQECDGIILGSPSYFGTFTGQLKVFLDRLRVMRHTDFQLGNKVVGALSVAGRRHGGQEITNLDLIQAMLRHNTIIVNENTAVCQLGATGWSHTFDDPNSKVEDDQYGLQTAEGLGKRVAEVAKVIKASGLQQISAKYNTHTGKR